MLARAVREVPLRQRHRLLPDEARDLEGMVREVLAAAKLHIRPEAKRLLLARLGADRALSRAEMEKLALYAPARA